MLNKISMLVPFMMIFLLGIRFWEKLKFKRKRYHLLNSWKLKSLRLKVHVIVQYLEVQNDPHQLTTFWAFLNSFFPRVCHTRGRDLEKGNSTFSKHASQGILF